jgi:hypothetical protein
VITFGNATFHGALPPLKLNQPITAIAPTPNDDGYWLLGGDGGVFTFGSALHHGGRS